MGRIKMKNLAKIIIYLFILTILLSCSQSAKSILTDCDWVYPDKSNPTGAFKFFSNGEFNSSTIYFDIGTQHGTWKDIGSNKVKLTYNDDRTQTIFIISSNKLKVGNTIYKKYK